MKSCGLFPTLIRIDPSIYCLFVANSGLMFDMILSGCELVSGWVVVTNFIYYSFAFIYLN